MIRKLRHRFVWIAQGCMLLVLFLVLGSVNVTSYVQQIQQEDEILDYLISHENGFELQEKAEQMEPQHDTSEGTAADMPAEIKEAPSQLPIDFSAESYYTTRYFTIQYDRWNRIAQVSTDHIASVSQSEAAEYAQQVRKTGKDSGYYQTYRYLFQQGESGSKLIFLDCEKDLGNVKKLLILSCSVAIASYLLAVLLIVLFSKRVVRPLEENMEKQKQFISDAGHELKTPITIISTNAEILELDPENKEWTDSIKKQVMRLNHLVKELIRLAKLDEINREVKMESVDLTNLGEETMDNFVLLATQKERTLEYDIQKNLEIHGNEDDIRQLISILADNAIKYSTQKSRISFSMKESGRNICMKMENFCSPMTPEQLKHMSDRFYRADASRSSQIEGYGLGLSIAVMLAKKYKGRVVFENPTGEYLTVWVYLSRG